MSKYIRTVAITVLSLTGLFLACGEQGPAEIHYGDDQCEYCKMTVADKSFGSEMITAKGKVYKFDSIECLAAYHVTSGLAAEDIRSMWVTDFSRPGSFLNLERAVIVATEDQKSPMGIGLLAVDSPQLADKVIETVGGKILRWDQVQAMVTSEWNLKK